MSARIDNRNWNRTSGARRRRRSSAALKRAGGFTLIELMVAMTVGLIVLGALVTLLVQTNQASRVSTGVARMQENARFALDLIARDIRMTASQYCTAFDNEYPEDAVNTRRALRVHNSGPMPHNLPNFATVLPPPGGLPNSAYLLSPRYFVQGHECGESACLPDLYNPLDINTLAADAPRPPAMGAGAGQRPLRSDVLTLRYLAGQGVTIISAPGGLDPLGRGNPIVAPTASLNFQPGDLAMIADCGLAEVFVPLVEPMQLTPVDTSRNNLSAYIVEHDARVFNFTRDFWTVTYFLRNKEDPSAPGRIIPVLVRQLNGQAQELVEGVERLDFRYRVVDRTGGVHVLTADQVQSNVGPAGVIECQRPPEGLIGLEPGCLWRSVQAVHVGLLVNTVENVLPQPSGNYTYSIENEVDVPSSTPMLNGLPPERMLRREFQSVVSLRAQNN